MMTLTDEEEKVFEISSFVEKPLSSSIQALKSFEEKKSIFFSKIPLISIKIGH